MIRRISLLLLLALALALPLAAQSPLTLRPSATPTIAPGLFLRIHSDTIPLCTQPNCSDVQVRVGGLPVGGNRLRRGPDNSVWFMPPQHAPGLVQVTVTTGGTTYSLPLHYFSHDQTPDLAVFERILFPILFGGAGAHGSQWVSEVVIQNPRPWYVENFNRVDSLPCIDYGCSELLSPGGTLRFDGQNFPRGIGYLVPRPEAADVAFSLRVRDTSREDEGLGTEIPVVRERDQFTNGEMSLLDVPLDPRYRTKLRVYVFDAQVPLATVTAKTTFAVPLSRTCSGPACAYTPWYGEVDLPAGAADERTDVYITAGGATAPAWAFASVTNNDTQQITIVTPNGRGGKPCTGCGVF